MTCGVLYLYGKVVDIGPFWTEAAPLVRPEGTGQPEAERDALTFSFSACVCTDYLQYGRY